MIELRDYQKNIKEEVYKSWKEGYKNLLLVMPTGSGKTKTFVSIVSDTLKEYSTAIVVHRNELVQQICLTLCEEKIEHNIIASRARVRGIINAERRIYDKHFYNPHAKVSVISVDTFVSRKANYKEWALGVKQWIVDEAAHVLKENKWGITLSHFENARGLGVTATPERLDRKGLGSHADGLFDKMIKGPNTRDLIKRGFLCDYKIASPRSDFSNFLKKGSSRSDYSKKSLKEASQQSTIVGDVVENYLKFAKGKQAIVFTTDVITAKDLEEKFLKNNIRAKELNGNTGDKTRLDSLLAFQKKDIQVMINVDLFDEGLDVPGIEVVIMARPTKSLGKYLQMCGRGLRPAKDKEHLIIIDHVDNVTEHEPLPCAPRYWTLDRIKKSSKKLSFIRICSNIECNAPYDRALTECPWCGSEAIIVTRNSENGRVPPRVVDGDLFLIDPETIRSLEERSNLEDPLAIRQRVSFAIHGRAGAKAMKNQRERIQTQRELAEIIALWAGEMKNFYGYNDRKIHKSFYLNFEKTITESLGDKKAEMLDTINKIKGVLRYHGVRDTTEDSD